MALFLVERTVVAVVDAPTPGPAGPRALPQRMGGQYQRDTARVRADPGDCDCRRST